MPDITPRYAVTAETDTSAITFVDSEEVKFFDTPVGSAFLIRIPAIPDPEDAYYYLAWPEEYGAMLDIDSIASIATPSTFADQGVVGGYRVYRSFRQLVAVLFESEGQYTITVARVEGAGAPDLTAITARLDAIDATLTSLGGRLSTLETAFANSGIGGSTPVVGDRYCNVSDVADLLSQAITANSAPNSQAVLRWIGRGYHIINSFVQGQGYDTPITATDSPQAYAIVSELDCIYAGRRVLLAQRQYDEAKILSDEFEARLEDISKGRIRLIDAEGVESAAPSQSQHLASITLLEA